MTASPTQSPERMSGPDALFLHLETPTVPLHTLKVVVLDSTLRGPQITLSDLRRAVEDHLGVVPRSTQRVVTAGLGFGARPFWVEDDHFDLDAHLDEARADSIDGAGRREDLDAICTRLAETHLDRSRPLWAMTLVHGLDQGRQAVVVRVHHALTDGLGALNTLLAVTTAEPGRVLAPPAAAAVRSTPVRRDLRRIAVRDLVRRTTGLGELARLGLASRHATRTQEQPDIVPSGLGTRSTLNARSSGRRVCASADLDLADLKRVSKATGATINGVLHGVLAGALRAEMTARGETTDSPVVATFGVAGDTTTSRTHGNDVGPAHVHLHVHVADPVERLLATARSCLVAVDLRRRRGFDLTDRAFTYAPRLPAALGRLTAAATDRVVNHVTTANVAGPRTRRWLGTTEVVDWISYAVAIDPANVNLTAYSYAGRLSIGLVATPEAMPDPAAFLARLGPELERLAHLTTHPTIDQESHV